MICLTAAGKLTKYTGIQLLPGHNIIHCPRCTVYIYGIYYVKYYTNERQLWPLCQNVFIILYLPSIMYFLVSSRLQRFADIVITLGLYTVS